MRLFLVAAALVLVVAAAVRAASARFDEQQRDLDEQQRTIAQLDRKVDSLGAAASRASSHQRSCRPDPSPDIVFAVPIDGNPVDGPSDALVTIVVGYEYACPYCAKAQAILRALRERFPDDVRIARKAFIVHPQVAIAPALGACAANHQGRFAAMDALLWEAHRTRHFDAAHIRVLAAAAGLDLLLFDADITGRCQDEVSRDQAQLQDAGMRAIPTFYINGHHIAGARPIEELVAVIDDELRLAHERIAVHRTARTVYYDEWVIGHGRQHFTPPRAQ